MAEAVDGGAGSPVYDEQPEPLYLVCTECEEVFDTIGTAKAHEADNCTYEYDEEGGSYLIHPESVAM